jgi:hypothetical protein
LLKVNGQAVYSRCHMRLLLTFILFLIFSIPQATTARNPVRYGNPTAVIIQSGFTNNTISDHWKDALKSRMDQSSLDSLARIHRPLSSEELEWQQLITAKALRWNSFRDSLSILFPQIQLPDTIQVLLGFQGNDDGFTFGKRTVCIDLTALCRAYGKASLQENDSRIDRIFSHEYTHLLHKAWAVRNNLQLTNFKDSILWECLYEGAGTYRSLNARWLPVNGVLPAATTAALQELYPVFAERLILIGSSVSLAEDEKVFLSSHLSRGNVNQKWGAFTVAIWLTLEGQGDERKLAAIINKGPAVVLQLAHKYLPAKYRDGLEQVYNK